jgi:L-alanine-DL-glutamate epimerase-like enolase superfamily enzyme
VSITARTLTLANERWPIAGAFRIARGAKTEAHVITVTLSDGPHVGRGEAVPYGRYGESIESVNAEILSVKDAVEAGMDRAALQSALPPGAARNAIDCALWDLEAKRAGQRAWTLAGLARLDPVKTAYTISLDTPEKMGEAARAAAGRPMLKLKIGAADDLQKVEAVRANAPRTRLVVDANEALDIDTLNRLVPDFTRLGVKMIEQPLPVADDEALAAYTGVVPLCADESLHSRAELARCARLYQAINIKLDKTGGLTEALALRREADALGLMIMAGCMVSTSLAMAPALLIAQGAEVVDLDGPLLLARDRDPGLSILGSMIEPPPPELWG